MSKQFEGKVAVITGGSSGIGRAAAIAFAAEGARVAIGSRRAPESEETIRLIEEKGGEAIFVQTDVSKAAQVQHLVQAAVDRWQRLDFAFNNAGVSGPTFVPIPDYPEDGWNHVIDINLKGVFLSMKYEIPAILKSGGGAIVNMSSIAGLIGGRVGSAYYASKAGVIGLTRAAAMEYCNANIRVNAVCPAVIETPMAEGIFASGRVATLIEAHPLGRFGKPEEVADSVIWLCSEKSSFITGQALPIDGGYTTR
jgi:NAD(P)-dependent dehydrogenase (short-subunit alcohol dehydrogenase family)